jgi:hypothetical protein
MQTQSDRKSKYTRKQCYKKGCYGYIDAIHGVFPPQDLPGQDAF